MNNKNKIFKILILSISLIMLVLLLYNITNTNRDISYNMKITFFDVGKADAILIEVEDKAIMIDTGEYYHGENIVSHLNEKEITELEYLILTHPDKDHIGGAVDIINSIKINNLIESTLEKDTDYYKNLREATANNNLEPIFLREEYSFYIGDISFIIYPPIYDNYEISNDYSLIVRIIDGDNTFLFTGDAENIRLNEFLEQSTNINHKFLKVPHHGILDEASFKFIEAVNPTYAVITTTRSRILKRDTEVISWLELSGVETYVTAFGDITVLSDGLNIHIYQ